MRDSPINGTIKENNTFTLKTLRYTIQITKNV